MSHREPHAQICENLPDGCKQVAHIDVFSQLRPTEVETIVEEAGYKPHPHLDHQLDRELSGDKF